VVGEPPAAAIMPAPVCCTSCWALLEAAAAPATLQFLHARAAADVSQHTLLQDSHTTSVSKVSSTARRTSGSVATPLSASSIASSSWLQ
jgi:hypothetical protein